MPTIGGVLGPLRFGYQLGAADDVGPLGVGRRAEELGFDTVVVGDHVGPGRSPMVMLAAIAGATERIRLGTLVLNNDMRNPVQLAWDASTLDHLSGGRVELGLGAGHTAGEYAATGIAWRSPRLRKARLMESVEVVRRLLDGESVTFEGQHVHVVDAMIDRSAQARLPILVGGNGTELLEHAGAHADIVGLQGLGRTLADGHRHDVRWDGGWLDVQVAQVRRGAGERIDEVELSVLVQRAVVTDDRPGVLAEICAAVDGLTIEQAAAVPYLLVGTVDEIVEQICAARTRWGITYFVVRTLDDFAPVLAAAR